MSILTNRVLELQHRFKRRIFRLPKTKHQYVKQSFHKKINFLKKKKIVRTPKIRVKQTRRLLGFGPIMALSPARFDYMKPTKFIKIL